MRPLRDYAALQALRQQPLWRLLAADTAPAVLAIFQTLLLEADKTLPASVLSERLAHMLDQVRADGERMPQQAPAYIADWLSQGWLTRRLPAGASEEVYELSTEAAHAVRFITGLLQRRVLATESRLAGVMQQLLRLAEETDPNPQSRIAALLAERERIDREIESVTTHGVKPLDDQRAIERAREIIVLSDELAADFRRVRDDFDQLNRGLRQSLVENDGSRGDVLEALFAGVDLIGESDAGKTFSAFWRLLTNPEQAELLRDALSAIGRRPFVRKLQVSERKFLLSMTALLTDEGSRVHDVLQSFARSLKSFVQSREYLEQRRLHSLLKQATQAALQATAWLRPNQDLGYELTLTSSRVRSVSQHGLYDPAERVLDSEMADGEASDLDLSIVGELVRQSEIDFRALRRNLRAVLTTRERTTIAQLLESFPAVQGLGSVVGYLALGAKHGQLTSAVECVSWRGQDRTLRRARVPTIYFSRERYDELVD